MTIPPVLTEVANLGIAGGVIAIGVSQWWLRSAVKDLGREVAELRNLHLDGGRAPSGAADSGDDSR